MPPAPTAALTRLVLTPLEAPVSVLTHRAIECEACANNQSAGQFQHPAPHADSQGVVGRDEAIQGAKIEPLEGNPTKGTAKSTGLDDEQIDSARIQPGGEVREELS